MDNSELLQRACLRLGVQPAQVVGVRYDETYNVVRVLVNYGKDGTKRHNIPMRELPELPKLPKPRTRRTNAEARYVDD